MKLSFINDSGVKLRCCDLFVEYHNESRNISVSLNWKFWPSREILLLLIIIVLTYLFHYYLIPVSKVGREARAFGNYWSTSWKSVFDTKDVRTLAELLYSDFLVSVLLPFYLVLPNEIFEISAASLVCWYDDVPMSRYQHKGN